MGGPRATFCDREGSAFTVIGRLFAFLRRLFSGSWETDSPKTASTRSARRSRGPRRRPVLNSLRYQPSPNRSDEAVTEQPRHRFSRWGPKPGTWWDFSQDGDAALLKSRDLPIFETPEQMADWLQISAGRLAWFAHQCVPSHRPKTVETSHYHYTWLAKRSGGQRLIESPKPQLKAAQVRILRDILDHVPSHKHAHGFVRGRSITTNAAPHVGRAILVRFDLENFYANVGFSRVVAIFRRLGYCREAALWLARLTTTALPINAPFANGDPRSVTPYWPRHLPQGAPTSPAIANLSAYALDVRLTGFAASFGVRYTRYADDLTFSGSQSLNRALPTFLPMVTKIIQNERFRVNRKKRKVLRADKQQRVTGVVVNAKLNVSRRDYDRLKAILHNCRRTGPLAQNRNHHADFAAHLRGRISHVAQLNPQRGEKLQRLFDQIRW